MKKKKKKKTWWSQIPYQPGAWTTDQRRMIPKTFSHWCEGSEPHIMFPGLGIWHRDRNPQGICHWSPARFDHMPSRALGKTEMPLLEGTDKTVHAPRLMGKEQWQHKRLKQTDLPASVADVAGWWLAAGTEALATAVLEASLWHKLSWRLPLTLPWSPKSPRAGSP